MSARQSLVGFLAGTLFAGGLIVSGMTDPLKVQNFLDPFGRWDPSLALVMAAALAVTAIGYRIVRRWDRPRDAAAFHLPDAKAVTPSLLIGSALFGVGWGVSGLCPGPAIAVLPMAPSDALWFAIGLMAGMAAFRGLPRRT